MSGSSAYVPQESGVALVRKPAADHGAGALVLHRLPEPAQPELLLDVRRHSGLHAGGPDHHRRGAGHALHTGSHDGVPIRRAHHARRELRLDAPLPPRQRRLDVLRGGVYPHRPRHVLRVLQGPARNPVDPRRHHLPADDGHRLHGLRPALGTDELLGREGHHQPVFRHSGGGRRHHDLAVGRLFGGQRHAQPLLLAALPVALHDPGCGGAAHLGPAHPGVQQPGRGGGQEPQGHPAVPSVFHGQGRVRAGLLPAVLFVFRILRPELPRPRRQLHPGKPAADARRTSFPNGTSCRSTRCSAPFPPSSVA